MVPESFCRYLSDLRLCTSTNLVRRKGFEPLTSSMSRTRSLRAELTAQTFGVTEGNRTRSLFRLKTTNAFAALNQRTRHHCYKLGGEDGGRTRDLIVANDALSQLSYFPGTSTAKNLVEIRGVEPLTSSMPWMRS